MTGGLSRVERIATARRNFVSRAQYDRERLLASFQRWQQGASEELATIRALAHRLRGTAGSFGFATTSKAASELEMAAQERGPDEIAEATQHLILELAGMQADNPS